jgi:hypothetical protein
VFSAIPGSPFPIGSTDSQDFAAIDISEIDKIPSPHIAGCVIYRWRHDAPGVFHKTGFVSPLEVLNHQSVRWIGSYAIEPD